MENNDAVFRYAFSQEEWLEGFNLYHKLYRRKFTYIKAAIFAIPLLLFIQSVFVDPYYTMGYICIAVCAAAAVCILMTPKLERRSYEHAIEYLVGDSYELKAEGSRLSLSTLPAPDAETPSQPTVIDISDKSYKGIETENIFGAFTKYASIVVPKRSLSADEQEALRRILIIKQEKTEN